MIPICSVYRSPLKEGMYLYIPKGSQFDHLPESLRQRFGKPLWVMDLILKEDRKLARIDRGKLLSALEDPGWYLQMPPGKESYMLDLFDPNARSAHEC